jgi:hypothetical protein
MTEGAMYFGAVTYVYAFLTQAQPLRSPRWPISPRSIILPGRQEQLSTKFAQWQIDRLLLLEVRLQLFTLNNLKLSIFAYYSK